MTMTTTMIYCNVSLKALSHEKHERSLSQEKVAEAERELSAAVAEHARQKRELMTKQDQQTRHIDALQLELSDMRQRLEHTKYALHTAVLELLNRN